MPIERTSESNPDARAAGTPGADDLAAPADPIAQAIAELRAEQPPNAGEDLDRYWLRVGLRLAAGQPGRASLLLAGLEASGTVTAPAARSTAAEPDELVSDQPPATVADGRAEDAESDGDAPDPDAVPLRSLLLARSAALPASADAETVYGWVEQLTPTDVRRLGHAVTELLANGASHDLERGFGLAWSAGVHLPPEDMRKLFSRFGDLELAVCGVLGGRKLLGLPAPKETAVSALLSAFMPRTIPGAAEANVVLEREGDTGRRGLVAVWNAWIALRYRDRVPAPLFEQLVRPWVAVVGRVPDA